MLKLTPEHARILVMRITKVLRVTKYDPAKALDIDALAKEVVRPYVRLELEEKAKE